MAIKQKTLHLSPIDYYTFHLTMVNTLFDPKLTLKEVEILAEFMVLDKSITSVDMFNTYARRIVREKLDISFSSLSNCLSCVRKKGYLHKNEITGIMSLDKLLLCDDKMQGYQFKAVKND